MEAVASINQRILEIRSHIATVAPPVVVTSRAAALGTGATQGASFASALADAMGTTSASMLAPTEVGSGKSLVNAKGVPNELLVHGNGKVPADALSEIGDTGHRLWTPAARSLEALRDDAARDGVTIGITDSYRTYESQVDLAQRKGLYSQGGLAAAPGTSMHGWGMATDLKLDATAQAWMRENAGRYGFVEDTPREPWHWGYHPTH
ncbi:M15 family metallopeptidase [Actinotalea subterranea]|uniref:M15 family metallopeptidase n=1 Tax=Actinotalea subterranea TaxID=2607497 RepID=UPI001CAA850C|nr:M15 family metallopeptidase [Actinotalea subterranea]